MKIYREVGKLYREAEVWPKKKSLGRSSLPSGKQEAQKCSQCDRKIPSRGYWIVCEEEGPGGEKEIPGAYCSKRCAQKAISLMSDKRP